MMKLLYTVYKTTRLFLILIIFLLLSSGCDKKEENTKEIPQFLSRVHHLKKLRDLAGWGLLSEAEAGYLEVIQKEDTEEKVWEEFIDILRKQGKEEWMRYANLLIKRFPGTAKKWRRELFIAAIKGWNWKEASQLLTHICENDPNALNEFQKERRELDNLSQIHCVWEEQFSSELDQDWVISDPFRFRLNLVNNSIIAKLTENSPHYIARRFRWPGGNFILRFKVQFEELPLGGEFRFGLFSPVSQKDQKSLEIAFSCVGESKEEASYPVSIAGKSFESVKKINIISHTLKTWYRVELEYVSWLCEARLRTYRVEDNRQVGEHWVKVSNPMVEGEYWLGISPFLFESLEESQEIKAELSRIEISADRAWEACTEKLPLSDLYRVNLAFSRKSLDDVLKEYQKALDSQPYEWLVWNLNSTVHQLKGEKALADLELEISKRILENHNNIDKERASKYFKLCKDSLLRSKTRDCLIYLNESLNKDPLYIDALLVRSHIYNLLKKSEDALLDLNIAYLIQPKDWKILDSRYKVYITLKENNKAIQDLNTLIKEYPDSPNKKKWEEALAELSK